MISLPTRQEGGSPICDTLNRVRVNIKINHMTILNRIWAWLLLSSSDPNKVSLTIKGALVGLLTAITMVAGVANIQLPSEALTQSVDGIIAFVQTSLLWVSSAVTAWGAIRKVWTSISGDNKVINSHEAFR